MAKSFFFPKGCGKTLKEVVVPALPDSLIT